MCGSRTVLAVSRGSSKLPIAFRIVSLRPVVDNRADEAFPNFSPGSPADRTSEMARHAMKPRVLRHCCLALLSLGWIGASLLPAPRAQAKDTAPPELTTIGTPVTEFDLQDPRGRKWTLADFADSEVLVVAFLGTECPLAKLYGNRLSQLEDTFRDRKVRVIGVNSNSQDSLEEVAQFGRDLELNFLMLKDPGNRLADRMKAQRTPEVFVLDSQRHIRYTGRIDDQYGIGFIRNEPQRHDLQIAIEELLAGKSVSVPATSAPGCLIGRAKSPSASGEVTYESHIASILQARCVQCHRSGEIGPFALTDYDEVAGWADMIAEVVREGRMPPWHAETSHVPLANDRRLTTEEKQLIERWAAAGAPQGVPSAAVARSSEAVSQPSTVGTVAGAPTISWQLPRDPDLIVNMAETPTSIAAEGAINYRYFQMETGLTEDRWIQAVDVQPGNRAVVHHILVFATTGNDQAVEHDFGGGVRGFLAGYVPGMRAEPFPDGMAKFLPAGSKLVFQMHYTPNGKEQQDLSRIGFVFADPSTVKYEVETRSAFQPRIRIPRQAANHAESTKTRLHQDVRLLGLMPHMHVRGKAFRYLMKRPTDTDWVTLLDVPAYDFNWQTAYRLADPLELPANTAIKCIAHYDNSSENPNNPNPGDVVRWGEQTWEEMLIGYFDVAFPVDPVHRPSRERMTPTERIDEFVLQHDDNDDFQLQLTELPLQMRLGAISADADGDKILSPTEIRQAFRRQ